MPRHCGFYVATLIIFASKKQYRKKEEFIDINFKNTVLQYYKFILISSPTAPPKMFACAVGLGRSVHLLPECTGVI